MFDFLQLVKINLSWN